MKYILISVHTMLLTCMLACENRPSSNEFDELGGEGEQPVVQEVVWLRIRQKEEGLEYIYQAPSDSLPTLFVRQDLKSDSTLKVNNVIFHLESRKTFSSEKKSRDVKRYICYESEGSFRGTMMYFVDNYGMIGTRNRWSFSLFAKGQDFDKFIVECLRADSTGFFKFKNGPRAPYFGQTYQLDSL